MLPDLSTWSLVPLKREIGLQQEGIFIDTWDSAGPAPGEKATHLGKPYLQIDLACTNLSAGHIQHSFFKCVFSFDVHVLHLLILMRPLRNSWQQRETSAPSGMHSLLAKAVTAIVWAARTTTWNLLKRRWSIHGLSLEHCHSEVWLICILIRASEKASKSLQCTI